MNKKLLVVTAFVFVLAVVVGGLGTAAQASQSQGEPAWMYADYSGHTLALGYAEIITDPLSGEAGGIEYFRSDLGNGQLSHDFVYGDPRASWKNGHPGITFAVKDGNTSADVNLTNQVHWLHESIWIWNNQTCADLTLKENPANSALPGLVENIFAGGGVNIGLVQADLTQVGFRSAAEFAYFAANPNVLGVTFTLFWVDANGNVTDIDGNGKIDAALREIYYNDQFEWADNGLEGNQGGVRYFDFPTVAIHEAGHGFSAAHFGNIGLKDGALIANPRSIMNAIYGGTLRDLQGRDIASTCSNWAQWPQR